MKPIERSLWLAAFLLISLQVFGGAQSLLPGIDGPVEVVVVHETLDQSPEMARLITSLQTGETQKYLTSKGHALAVLDDENPAVKAEWTEGVQLPAVAVLDGKTKAVLYREPLPATAEQLLAWLKGKGA